MTTSSLRLIVELQSRGVFSKEAAADVLAQRNALIRSAFRKVAADLIVSLRAVAAGGEVKEAAFGDFLNKFRRGAENVKEESGALAKLKSGGFTGKGPGQTAGWGDVGMNLTKMLGLAGLTAGATAGVGAVMRHSRDKKVKSQIQDSYHQMFNEVPRLKEYHDDPAHRDTVERNFGILAQFAPSLAAVPSVAGNWVQATVKMPLGPAEIKTLAETQRRIDEMHEGRHSGPGISDLKVDQIAQKAMGG